LVFVDVHRDFGKKNGINTSPSPPPQESSLFLR
jgi:hypothetical protein